MKFACELLVKSKLLVCASLLILGLGNSLAQAPAVHADLAVIKPVKSCASLAATDLTAASGETSNVTSAAEIGTEKGAFCRVVSHIDPAIEITTYLPVEHWTQRYYQAAGVVAGPNGFPQAGTCQPALNGEFAYAGSNQRFTMVVGDINAPGWKPDSQKRIDYAYRANHLTALVSKLLIGAYYGQAPRYAYFMGCSEGGREALVEAQRFPNDFDGISAGAPGLLDTMQESMFHIWKMQSNTRADGTNILLPAKLQLLHEAVIAHCDTASGVKDGLLENPGACDFQPASMQCAANASDHSQCFTAEEVAAIDRLYEGAHDAQGHYFYWGLQRGSELQWDFPKTAVEPNRNALVHAEQLAYILLPAATPAFADPARVTFTQTDFTRAITLSSLFDAGSTNLKPFAAHGGKLIIWHGISDTMIPVEDTIAYYRGLLRTMGKAEAETMVRAFFLPGVGHCGGGDGYDQIDTLSALMAWVEQHHAPARLIAGKVDLGSRPSVTPGAAQSKLVKPYATPVPQLIATRPVYPFPSLAVYDGKGDPHDAANYRPVVVRDLYTSRLPYEALALIGPNVLRNYQVINGKIAPTP